MTTLFDRSEPNEAALAFLPDGIEPHPDPGRCAFVAADWQSCSEHADELVDPSRSQYKEVFVVVSRTFKVLFWSAATSA